MFFILSKVLSFLFSPYFWILLILIISLFIKGLRLKHKLQVFSIVLLLFFSNSFICNEVIRLWEIPATKYENLHPPYDYGIVLCGMATYDEDFQRINFLSSIDRLLQAVDLYKTGKVKKIFLVGGSGSIIDTSREAIFLRDYLIKTGFPSEDLIIEPDSRNTRENAVFAMNIIREHKLEGTYLLITSAFHMRRSIGCFRQTGLTFDVFSTNRMAGPRKFTPDDLIIPNPYAMGGWSLLFHEILGYFIYMWKGYL